MNLVRKLALGLSAVILVALVVVGYARRAQLADARDHELTSATELGSERVASLVGSLVVAADAGSDPAAAVASVARLAPQVGVCAVSDTEIACGGEGPQPSTDRLADRQERRLAGLIDDAPQASMRDGLFGVEVDGAEISVLVQITRADLLAQRDGSAPTSELVDVWVTDTLPPGTRLGEFLVADGERQYAVQLADLPGMYLVAAGDNSVRIPQGELSGMLVLGILAIGLGLLAGFSSILDLRSLRDRASTDQLTRLPNRSEFERRTRELIAQSEKSGRGFAVLLFDLNGFKAVNDTYGHAAGDQLLQIVGERLARGTRQGDTVARWGGDEFVVVMPGVVDDAMGARRAREIATLIGGRTRLDSARESVRVAASVGVAFWPRHGATLQNLIESADAAMYTAKRQGLGVAVAGTVHVPDTVPTEFV